MTYRQSTRIVTTIAAVVFACCCNTSHAQIVELWATGCDARRCWTAHGTAISVAPGCYLTARHNVASVSRVWVRGRDKWLPATIESRHPTLDVAMLRAKPLGITLQVDDHQPASVKWYGMKTRRHIQAAARYAGRQLWLDSTSRPGDSGGAVYGPSGRLVGVVVATTESESLAVPVSACRPWLDRWCTAPLPPRPPKLRTMPDREASGRIRRLEQRIADLEKRLAAGVPRGERGLPGLRGIQGQPGERGPAGKITVIITDKNGQELHRVDHVRSGSTVRVPIERRN